MGKLTIAMIALKGAGHALVAKKKKKSPGEHHRQNERFSTPCLLLSHLSPLKNISEHGYAHCDRRVQEDKVGGLLQVKGQRKWFQEKTK